VRFGFSTIERWYYAARSEADPVGVLARRVRKDAGKDKAITQALLEELARQYAAHRGWSYKLHAGVRRVRRARRVEHAPAALVEVEVPQGVDRDRLVRARLAVLASEQGAPLARRGMPWNAVRPPPAALHRLAHRRVARRWAEPCVVGLRQHREVVGFEARFGPVPLTLLSWVRIVGDVWLVGTHPLWPESAGRGPPRDRGGRDTLRRWIEFFVVEVPATAAWKRLRGLVPVEVRDDSLPDALLAQFDRRHEAGEAALHACLAVLAGAAFPAF